MVPALLETLPQLPTLASGKVDRKSLPAPRTRPAEERRDLVPPRTALEKQIVAVWEKLFAPTPVSVQDDFFLDLGGHSLLAARMVSELRKSPPLPRSFRCSMCISIRPSRSWRRTSQASREGERPREPKHFPKSGLAGNARPPGGGALLAAFLLRGRPVGQPVLHPELLRPAMAGALSDLHRADRRGIRLPPGRPRRLRQPHRAVSADAGDPDCGEVDHDWPLPPGLLSALGHVLLPLVVYDHHRSRRPRRLPDGHAAAEHLSPADGGEDRPQRPSGRAIRSPSTTCSPSARTPASTPTPTCWATRSRTAS